MVGEIDELPDGNLTQYLHCKGGVGLSILFDGGCISESNGAGNPWEKDQFPLFFHIEDVVKELAADVTLHQVFYQETGDQYRPHCLANLG